MKKLTQTLKNFLHALAHITEAQALLECRERQREGVQR